MSESLGKKIKGIRKQHQLTQKQLAEGICTQALISMFESDETIPSSVVLYKIAQKLNVSLDYFFEETRVSNKINAQDNETFVMIRSLVRSNEYVAAEKIVEEELKNHTYLKNDLAFLLWHQAICKWEIHREKESALELFKNAIETVENDIDLLIAIKNSKAIILADIGDFDEAIKIFNSSLEYFNSKQSQNSMLHRRVLLGLSRAYGDFGMYEHALAVSEDAIKLNIQEESLYLLGELVYQKARMLAKLNKHEQSIEVFNQAKAIFQIQDNSHYVSICNDALDYMNNVLV